MGPVARGRHPGCWRQGRVAGGRAPTAPRSPCGLADGAPPAGNRTMAEPLEHVGEEQLLPVAARGSKVEDPKRPRSMDACRQHSRHEPSGPSATTRPQGVHSPVRLWLRRQPRQPLHSQPSASVTPRHSSRCSCPRAGAPSPGRQRVRLEQHHLDEPVPAAWHPGAGMVAGLPWARATGRIRAVGVQRVLQPGRGQCRARLGRRGQRGRRQLGGVVGSADWETLPSPPPAASGVALGERRCRLRGQAPSPSPTTQCCKPASPTGSAAGCPPSPGAEKSPGGAQHASFPAPLNR